MERVGPSCSRQQCAAPPSAPRIKLKNGLTAPRNTDLGERPHPIFPHARASPKGTWKLKTSSRLPTEQSFVWHPAGIPVGLATVLFIDLVPEKEIR
jgi:hypothetical protein